MYNYKLNYTALLVMLFFSITTNAFENGQVVRLIRGGKSLMVENSSLDVSKNAVLWTETNTHSQRWILEDTGKGTFNLKNIYTQLYLGGITSAGANAVVGQIAKSTVASRGSWELVPVEGKTNIYNIYISTARRYALSSVAEIADGTGVKLLTVSSADPALLEWQIVVDDNVEPYGFSANMRDDMMNKFKARHYKKQGTGYSIDNGGWWGDAEMFETVLDALETTGDQQYATMFENLYTNFLARNQSTWYKKGVNGYNEYNDDIAWMCIACVRGYLLTGTSKYLTTAKNNFNGMFQRADCYGNDLLQWKHGSGQGTNACINGPASVCACYLAIATADMSYYEKAKKTYLANRAQLYEFSNGQPTGKVWDSYDQSSKSYNYWASTYNQGTCLGAAIMLYNYYGDEMFKKDAEAIANWTKKDLADSHGIIKVCQTVRGDLCGFKGILMRYIRMYAAELGHPENYEWLANNAYHAWNNRNSGGITSSAWLTKSEEDYKHQEGTELKTFEAFGNSTCLSAAFNAHLGVVDQRNAYDKNLCYQFNFNRNTPITQAGTDEDGAPMAGIMKNNHYIGYRNVDFGDKAASHIDLRAYLYRATTKVNVYVDGPDAKSGTLLCTITPEDGAGITQWDTFSKALNMPVSGNHRIYFVVTGTSGANLACLNWFRFSSVNTLYGDMTNNGGVLTTSMEGTDNLLALTDDDVTTGMSGTVSDSEPWIQYISSSPVRLYGYILNSGMTQDHPQAWKLLGSNDGKEWTLLHEQADTTVAVCSQRFMYDLAPEQTYTHFRLQFQMPEGKTALALSEWQLLGRGISEFDITADGGTITEGMDAVIDHVGENSIQAPVTAVYHSTGNYVLSSYSITCNDVNTPSSWTLEGSTNGSSWKALDTRSDVVFPYLGSTVVFNVDNSTPYIYYRLKVTEEGSGISQWQLFGNLDFGTFYADVTSLSTVSACDGSDAYALLDDNGKTSSTIQGDSLYWLVESPVPVRVVGVSILPGADAQLDPKDVVLVGFDEDGAESVINSRTLSFAARGSRVTYTVSNTKLFRKFQLKVNSTVSGEAKASLAALEIYGTVILTADDAHLVDPASVSASKEAVATTEAIGRLNDKSRTTRYRADFSEPISITYSYNAPASINTYAITASKDNAPCDPTDWVLEGSNDGQTWTLLDSRSGELFSSRYATQFYQLAKNAEYSNYRLTVSKVNGGTQLMMTELQYLLLGEEEVTPVVTVHDMAEAEIAIRGNQVIVNTPEATTLRIYDPNGRLMSAHYLAPGTTSVQLPDGRGIYVVAMQNKGKNIVRKVMK